MRARTGTCASVPDVSAPLRERTGTRECPGPAPLRAWGTREPVPTAPLREGDGRVPRPCAAARERGEGGWFARLARGPAARNRQCACAAPGPAVRRKRGGWPRAGGGAQLPSARTGLRECPGTQHKHCLPCVCAAVCPQFDTSLLVITAGMVAGLSRQRRIGAGSDDFAAYALRRAAQPKTKRARTDGQEAHDVSLARNGRLGEAVADRVV